MNNNMMTGVPVVEPEVKKSSSGGLIVLIVILFLALFASCGYIVYDKMNNKEVIKKSTKDALETVNLEDNYLFQVEDSINTLENSFNYSQSSFFGYIYKTKNISIDDFNIDAALFACVHPYLESSNNISYVADTTVKNKFKSIFGNKLTYSPSMINAGADYFINFNNNYYYVQRIGAGGYFHPTYFTTVENVLVEEEEIQVIKNVGYVEYAEDGKTFNLFTDSVNKNLIDTIPLSGGSFNEKELIAKYKSKLAQYTYTFTLEKDRFVFEKIKRTK